MATQNIFVATAAAAVIVVSGAFYVSAQQTIEGTLHTSDGEHALAIEVADTPEARATGLMNRESLAEDGGMLFVYESPQPISMWMKNTLIPLDMLFLDAAGRVTHVKTNAEPLSLATISSNGPAQYVLELNGGAAQRLGVERGDRLEHPAIAAQEDEAEGDAPDGGDEAQ